MPVIIVTIIGIICIIVSFLMVEKEKVENDNLDAEEATVKNRITDEYELNEEEIAILQRKVSDKIAEDVKELIYDADSTLSTMTNEKMMAIGDYAVTVCDEIEKNHKEVMFLYSMLNDKEKELKELVIEVDEAASEWKKVNESAMETCADTIAESSSVEEIEKEDEEEMPEENELVVDDNNINDIILQMKKNGMSIMEIARELGLGVGEVKLVVDLYQENAG